MVVKIIRLCLFLLFVIFLTTMGVMTYLNPETRTTENRELSTFPEQPKTSKELGAWPKAVDTYLNEHIHNRLLQVRLFHLVRNLIGVSPQHSVIFGKDGWLFGDIEGLLDDYRNTSLFSEEEVARWISYLKYRKQHAAENNYHYEFLVAPNKATIYSEMMPNHITRVNPQSRFDQIINAAKKEGIQLMDIRHSLKEAKNRGRLYSKIDTHWNARGAEVAHVEVMKMLQKIHPKIKADFLNASAYYYGGPRELWEHGLSYYAGHLQLIAMQRHPDFTELQPIHEALKNKNLCHRLTPVTNQWLESPDHSSKESLPYETNCPGRPLRLLVFRDSFATMMRRFMSEQVGYALYAWLKPDMNAFNEGLKIAKPDVVIEERVERALVEVPVAGVSYPE